MVQQLGLHASNAAGTSSIPGQGTKIPHAPQYCKKSKKKILNEDTYKIKSMVYYSHLWRVIGYHLLEFKLLISFVLIILLLIIISIEILGQGYKDTGKIMVNNILFIKNKKLSFESKACKIIQNVGLNLKGEA